MKDGLAIGHSCHHVPQQLGRRWRGLHVGDEERTQRLTGDFAADTFTNYYPDMRITTRDSIIGFQPISFTIPPPARLHSGVHRVLLRCREASVGLTCALGSVRGPVQARTHICSSAMHPPRTRPPFSLPPPSSPSPTFLPDDPPRLSCENTASVTSLWGYMEHHLVFFAIIHALVVDVPSG